MNPPAIQDAVIPDATTRANGVAGAARYVADAIIGNGWLLTAARDYLASHSQMSADPMYLVDGKAWLYRRGEYVDLHVDGRKDGLPVFIFDPLAGWRELSGLDAKYAEWSRNGH